MSRLKPLRSYKTYLLSGMLPFLLLIVPLVTTTGCGDEESRSGAASTEPAEEVPAGSPEDPSSTDGTEESPTLGELLGGVICSSLGFDPTLGGGVLVLQYTPKSGTVEDVVKIKGVTGCATEKFSLENVDQIRFIPIITVDDQGHTDCQMPEGSEPLATLGSEEFTKRGTSLEFSVPSLKTDGWVGIEIYKGEQRIDLYYDDPEDPSDTPNKGCLAFDYQLSLGEVTDEILDTLENTIDDVTDLLDDGDEEDGSVIEHIDEILDTLENTIDDVTDLLDDGDDSDEGGVQIPDEVSDVIQDLLDDLIQVPEEGTGDDGIQIPDEVRDAIQKRLEDLVIVVEPGEEPEESPSIEEVAGDLAGALIDLLQAGGYFPFAIDLDSPTAVAVDPATGNVWVSVSSGVTGYQDLLRIENNGAKTTFLLSLRGVDNLDFDIEGNLLISAYNCIKKASIAEDDDLTISDVICLSDDDSITVNGIGVTPSNEIIFAATNKRIYGKIYGIDPSGVTRTLVEDLPFTPMDLTVDRTGRVFLTTDGTPTLMEVLQEGSVQTVLQGDAHTPSAVGLNLDGSLLVNDFVPLGDYRIIKTDGDVWMEGLDLVDMGGISSDPTGKYVAILDHGTGSVYRRTTSN